MPHAPSRKPHRPDHDVPESLEPGALPVEPDEGAVPAFIPEDPEHERRIDPGATQARRGPHPMEGTPCR